MTFGNGTTNPAYEFVGSGLVDLANGTADIPAGTNLALGGVSCTAGVTAANLNTLTDASDASALHYHGATTEAANTSALSVADVGYYSGADAISDTNTTAMATSLFAGVCLTSAASGTMVVAGTATVNYDGGIPAVNAPLYLSDTAGLVSSVAPTSGRVQAHVGIAAQAGVGAATGTVKMLIRPFLPIQT
jgi:hypothetical protein